jgi:hypothetical protein
MVRKSKRIYTSRNSKVFWVIVSYRLTTDWSSRAWQTIVRSLHVLQE